MTSSTKELLIKIHALITKASTSHKSDDALKFSQAAVNSANALNVILNFIPKT